VGAITPATRVQVILPVYNEANSIEPTLRELDKTLSPFARVELVVCEDGSSDGTRAILQRLAGELPLRLVLGEQRRGYSQAVIAGWRACTAPWVLCLDSDGQCDPRDFEAFALLAGDADVVRGWRRRREDSLARRAMSGLFRGLYRVMTRLPARDPSCPYLLLSRDTMEYLLAIPTLGRLSQGFWWEVVARLARGRFTCIEVPVNHRPRAAGHTQVYAAGKLAGIFVGSLWSLAKILGEPVPPRRAR
jgi:dolichol-phosphate mannosyltransferase